MADFFIANSKDSELEDDRAQRKPLFSTSRLCYFVFYKRELKTHLRKEK
jgi:hypothetical protein